METIDLSGVNLPIGKYENPYLDPEKLFRSKYESAVKHSIGIERFAYGVIPMSLLRSFVKLDPLYSFKYSPHRVTPPNRTRIRRILSVIGTARKLVTDTTQYYEASPVHYQGVTGMYGPKVVTSDSSSTVTTVLSSNASADDRSMDTTARTRPWYSKYGEFQFWKSTVYSPPRVLFRDVSFRTCVQGGTNGTTGWSNSIAYGTRTYGPSGARLGTGAVSVIETRVSQAIDAAISVRGPTLLKSALPSSREYTFARNIFELKDLSRSVHSLMTGMRALGNLEQSLSRLTDVRQILRSSGDALKEMPNQWVSYWFGWRTMYRDAVDLLQLPEKVAKRANWLMKQSGKPATYRSEHKWTESEVVAAPFTWETVPNSTGNTVSTTELRNFVLRVVVNAKFDFPILDTPTLQRDYFLRRIGVYPTITDLYDVIPWSWLLDWFTGLGNYLDLVETINSDQTLFNYGFITAEVKGSTTSIHKCGMPSSTSFAIWGQPSYVKTWTTKHVHTSGIDWHGYKRVDLASMGDAHTSDLDSLSPFQKSILGALISQKLRV